MGCASSKRVEEAVAADVYRPPPTSIAHFDIGKVEEPWLHSDHALNHVVYDDRESTKPAGLPALHFLEKMEALELAPKSWSEVSKALEELKPSLHQTPPPPVKNSSWSGISDSVHSMLPPRPELSGFRSVKENMFLVRDRQERESMKEEEIPRWRRDPLEGYPDRRPPGNFNGVVLYTTTLRGVRRTFEDCERMRRVVEMQASEAGLEVDERDVSLHGEFRKEVRELASEGAAVPRLFVAGRYLGGVEEVEELSETGKLGEIMRWVGRSIGGEKGKGGRKECEGCGGARFVPCLECSGSCKVVAEDGKGLVRCGACNENGLVLCPACH